MPGTVFLPKAQIAPPPGRVLTLSVGNVTLDLRDWESNGLVVQAIDIGGAQARQVVYPNPVADGQLDFTKFLGPKTVSLGGMAYQGALVGSRSAAIGLLGPFLNPRNRPVLTYALDNDQEPRQLVLTPNTWSAPSTIQYGPDLIAWTAQWVASDPIAYAETQRTASVGISSQIFLGRHYPRVFPQIYPIITTSPGLAQLRVDGNYTTWPVYQVFGPCQNPQIDVYDFQSELQASIVFKDIDVLTGHYLYIDAKTHAVWADGDPSQSRYAYLDFTRTDWTPLPQGVTFVRYSAAEGAPPATLLVNWRNAYLT